MHKYRATCVCVYARQEDTTNAHKERRDEREGRGGFFFSFLTVSRLTVATFFSSRGTEPNTKKKKKKNKKKRFFSFHYFIIIIFNIRQPNKEDHNKQGPWTVDGQRGTTQDGTPFTAFYFTRSLSLSLLFGHAAAAVCVCGLKSIA